MEIKKLDCHLLRYFYKSTQRRARGRATLLVVITFCIALIFYEFGVLTHLLERDYETHFSYELDVDIPAILMAHKTGRKPRVTPINDYNYDFIIKNANKCRQIKDTEYESVIIFYMIKSAIQNKARRDAIRKTWGWEARFSDVLIRRIFVLGTSKDDREAQAYIFEEDLEHKDIVQADFIDSYYNNTIKTMMGFKWMMQNCPKAQFIMFTDDDMYISTKNLLKFIRNPFHEDMEFRKMLSFDPLSVFRQSLPKVPLSAFDGRLLSGFVFSVSPLRHRMSKWYVSITEYPFSKYPPYVTAGAYVISYPTLEDMYYTSLYTKHFKFDDVYLGIVAKKCGIQPMHNENFHFYKKPYERYAYKAVIASHGYGDPDELNKVWTEQRSVGHA